MKEATKTILFWSPRILAILFAIFLSLFALDAFSGNISLWEKIKDFLIHLIPAFVILLLLCLAWKWEIIGALSYFALAIWYIVTSWGRFPTSVYIVIGLPLFIIAVLFLINWVSLKVIPKA